MSREAQTHSTKSAELLCCRRLVAGPCETAGLLSWEGTWPLPGHLTEAPSAKDVHTFLTLWILEMHFFLLVPPSLLFTHFPINGLPQ